MKFKRNTFAVIIIIISLLISLGLVILHNYSLWDDEPFPGGKTIRELNKESPDAGYAEEILRLQTLYSLPFFLIVFSSLVGSFFSPMYIKHPVKFLILLTFLWPFLVLFSNIGIFLSFGMFGGVVFSVGILLFSLNSFKEEKKRTRYFSIWALCYNLLLGITLWFYLNDWFAV
jgi:hypothetical protein